MRFGAYVVNGGSAASPELIGGVAKTAEELGYDAVWVTDHVVMPAELREEHPYTGSVQFTAESYENVYEAIATLSYLAGVTSRVRLLASVLVLPYRHPVVTAKMLATLDRLSGGRLIAGVGVGWLTDEFEAVGGNFPDRGAVTTEIIQIFKALWTEERPEYHGKFYDFGPLRFYPKPAQRPHPPIWVGGHSKPALRRAARYGDGWHATRQTVATMGALIAELRRYCERFDRDPATLTLSLKCNLRLDQPAVLGADLCGSSEQIAEQIRAYAALGIELIILDIRPQSSVDQQIEALERFANEIIPLTGG